MSYLLGQMEATRIIGESIHETGKKVILSDSDAGNLLLFLGASFVRAADRMQERMRDQTGGANS